MVKKDSVVIKSSPYGLTLVLDREISFEQLVREICKKFATSRSFFGTATLVLSIEGRPVSAEEAAVIVEAIQLNSDITISLIEEDNELKNIEMKEKIDRFYYENIYDNSKIIMGSVTKKDVVTSDGSIVILGDVKSKAIVQAAGNVIVMGSLEGSVYAGYPEDDKCYIAANQIMPLTCRSARSQAMSRWRVNGLSAPERVRASHMRSLSGNRNFWRSHFGVDY